MYKQYSNARLLTILLAKENKMQKLARWEDAHTLRGLFRATLHVGGGWYRNWTLTYGTMGIMAWGVTYRWVTWKSRSDRIKPVKRAGEHAGLILAALLFPLMWSLAIFRFAFPARMINRAKLKQNLIAGYHSTVLSVACNVVYCYCTFLLLHPKL